MSKNNNAHIDTKKVSDLIDTLLREKNAPSVNALSKMMGVRQSQLWRLINGQTLKPCTTFEKLCDYAHISRLSFLVNRNLDDCPELKEAVLSLWDGSRSQGVALAKVLRGVQRLKT